MDTLDTPRISSAVPPHPYERDSQHLERARVPSIALAIDSEGQTDGPSRPMLSPLHTFWEATGYVTRRDMSLKSWALARFIFSWVLALPQISAIVVSIVHAGNASVANNCNSMAVLNELWLAKLVLQCCISGGLLLDCCRTGTEHVHEQPVVHPLSLCAIIGVVSFVDVALLSLWIIVECFAIGEDGPRCLSASSPIFLVGIAVFVLAVVYYFPIGLLYCIRRSRCMRRSQRPRSPVSHVTNLEMGRISQNIADRLPLRFYIPTFPPSHPGSWDYDNLFQPLKHPFLPLEKSEARCSICLDDYREPSHALPVSASATQPDATLEPQPLRLLACSHHFHKECIDRYITQESARCPICRERVQAPAL